MDRNLENIWQEVIDEAKRINTLSQIEIAFFEQMQLQEISDNVVSIEVPNTFFIEWIKDKQTILKEAIENVLNNKKIKIKYIVSNKKNKKKEEISDIQIISESHNLHPKYTFENFVVGESNNFTYAACRAVAEKPGGKYNPLFIYGATGLGKTHLLHAIGNYVKKVYKDKKVYYINSELMLNEIVDALRNESIMDLREKYRKNDILLIDDVQFIQNKEFLQMEVFHTINTLYENNKQVVLASDRPPRELNLLEERLRSRFEAGLVCDIKKPDLETRIAILKKKAENEGIYLPQDVLYYIAENFKDNVRALEGALIRLISITSFYRKKINLQNAKEILGELLPKKEVGIEKVLKIISDEFNVSIKDLKSSKRTKDLAYARNIAMYVMREYGGGVKEIGELLGNKDHTTVVHAYKKIKKMIKENKELEEKINHIFKLIENE